MTDNLSKRPLNDQQIATLAILRVPFYTDKETGMTYVSKRYWYGINQALREALARAVAVDADHE
jgi:hypothetical protein